MQPKAKTEPNRRRMQYGSVGKDDTLRTLATRRWQRVLALVYVRSLQKFQLTIVAP